MVNDYWGMLNEIQFLMLSILTPIISTEEDLSDLTEGTPSPSPTASPFNPIEGFMFAHLDSHT